MKAPPNQAMPGAFSPLGATPFMKVGRCGAKQRALIPAPGTADSSARISHRAGTVFPLRVDSPCGGRMAVEITRLDYSAQDLRKLARSSSETCHARRLLALAAILDGARRCDARQHGQFSGGPKTLGAADEPHFVGSFGGKARLFLNGGQTVSAELVPAIESALRDSRERHQCDPV
jgi:hypothetical protein